ncbi:hypothetical protein JAAARDRAFT_310921 [Jaapia argillacea MUCL 33604]|uniref:F-box domain-containing protein n=1 Tax=Jaapia argillacea MUCL 33604 TaxID=933084 RepID=A0A067PRF0_9AGAM|nr:hypothetical protein JAAARDRAFT_310921 [Jaapia argillacea MUCL 33604]
MSGPRSFSDLPREILGYIFTYLTDSDVAQMCRLSKSVKIEAERILYRYVAFPTDADAEMSLLKTLARAPRLAERTFSNINRLTDLMLIEFWNEEDPLPSFQNFVDLLVNCSFQLRTLECSHIDFEDLKPFLARQPEITELILQHWEPPAYIAPLPNDFLANLEVARMDPRIVAALSSSPPLEHLQISFQHPTEDHELPYIDSLARFRSTLQGLGLERHGAFGGHPPTRDILIHLAAALPSLSTLSLCDQRTMYFYEKDAGITPPEIDTVTDLVTALSKFPCLEVFVLVAVGYADPHSLWWNLWDNRSSFGLVQLFMSACPSLRYMALPKSRSSPEYLGFSRAENGDVDAVAEELQPRDIDWAWRDF